MTESTINEMMRYYSDEYRGHYVPVAEFAELLPRACDIINNVIRMSGHTVDTIPGHLTDAVYSAVCAQVEYLYGHGGLEALAGGESGGNVSLGSFSYSGSAEALSADKLSSLCYAARSHLAFTGLLYRGVNAI